MRSIAPALLSFFVLSPNAMRLPSNINSEGLKIDYPNAQKECDNPVKIGDVVIIDYEGIVVLTKGVGERRESYWLIIVIYY